MKQKMVNNPAGAVKSDSRTALEKANLMGLMENFTLKAIGEMYNTSATTVHDVLTRQLLERSIGQVEERDEYTPDIYVKSLGAWKNSKERQSLINYKQLNK